MERLTAPNANQQRTQERTSSTEWSSERMKALTLCIILAYKQANQAPPEGRGLELEIRVWGYSLEDIPTEYLAECLKRALRNKRDDYLLKTTGILNQWDALKVELAAQQAERRALRLQEASRSGICTRCMGAGFLVDRADRLKPWARRCPECEGPAPEPERPRNSRDLTWSEWVLIHKGKYPNGCDKEHCIVCYSPLKGQLPQAFGWLQGAAVPSPEEDVSQFGKARRAQAAQEPEAVPADEPPYPDELFPGDDDDLPF